MPEKRQSTGRPDVPSPRVDVGSPDDRPHPDSFMLQTMMDITRAQGATTEALTNLKSSVDKLTDKLDKVDDLRVSVGKIETSLTNLTLELKSTKDRLDTVRNWVIGAAAVVMVAGAIIPLVVRFWPTPSSATLNLPNTRSK
jgi:hypothetical protein